MEEIWKDIEGYEGSYQVSDYGNVRGLDRYVDCLNGQRRFIRGRTIKVSKDSRNFYMLTRLCFNGDTETRLAHRLVAEAFIPNPNNYPQVNHKDEDKANNNVGNLEWCTHKYNLNYGTCIERIVISNRDNCKRRMKKVICLNDTKIFQSAREAGNYYHVDRTNISRVCNGIRKHGKGIKFAWAM